MYIATLRPKEGELRALHHLSDYSLPVESFLPNFIVKDSFPKTLNSITKKYHGKTLLDVRKLDSCGISELEELINNNNDYSSQFNIVYPIEILLSNSNSIENINYVRISRENMNGFFIQWLTTNLDAIPENVLIDFEFINDDVPDTLISYAIQIINLLHDKQITIMSGAIPQTVPVKSDVNYTLPRYEKTLYQQIQAAVKSKLIYGDYCTVSPLPLAGTVAIPIVQIKYTLDDNYIYVRNGQRVGGYDFVSVCREIINIVPNFDENYCWSNNYIRSVINENRNMGNASTWVSIGVNHHIHLCVDETI